MNTEKIYIVDDYNINSYVLSEYLKDLYSVVCFDNAQDCIDRLDTSLPHVILMDCNMPVMSGYDATLIIKQKHSEIRIIGITANCFVEDLQKCYDCGMESVLVKPIFKEALISTIEKKN